MSLAEDVSTGDYCNPQYTYSPDSNPEVYRVIEWIGTRLALISDKTKKRVEVHAKEFKQWYRHSPQTPNNPDHHQHLPELSEAVIEECNARMGVGNNIEP